MAELPTIALTPGEPAGCGPDLLLKLLEQPPAADIVAICDPELLHSRARQLGIQPKIDLWDESTPARGQSTGSIRVLPVPLAVPVQAGVLNPENAGYVLQCLRLACEGCLSQRFAAMVTGPVQKSIINDAGIAFSGHTEYLAEMCQAYPVMMLANERLRVALVTTHLPLSDVPNAINKGNIRKTLDIVQHDLKQRFGIKNPRIGVCGLNPHAGEDGHLGREEIEFISPLIKALPDTMDVRGPLPADTLFTAEHLQEMDAIIAMYHDQGLPALKALGFGETVNITLGLPIIRTSVDHGTALQLAGSGKARHHSLLAACNLAIELANQSRR